jgi:Metallo-beta-lactamase superfamily
MQIANGLHRIGSDTVNSYLVVDGGDVTIIDAGLPRYWKLLNSELARLGMTLDDVRALILTHGDTDHIGFAAHLHREKGIPAYLHPADADRARLEVKKPNSGWGPVKAGPLAGSCGTRHATAGCGSARLANCGRSMTVKCSTSPARPGSSTHQATRQGASPSTSRRSTLCSSATP